MRTHLAISHVLALGLAAASTSLVAQLRMRDRTPAAPLAVTRSAGLQEIDGELWGAGHAYKVRFAGDGFEFTPAFGRAAARNFPLRFTLVSIGREGVMTPLSAAPPRATGLRVDYDRGSAIERYDVGVDALKQSFVFANRPAGRGDLTVRGRLNTDLRVRPDGDGLAFELPGVGSCRMGGVVAIDARGREVRGSLRYAEGFVEMTLPAAFVDRAALPFVLDPPIAGASVISGTGGTNDLDPCVAYDSSGDVYLVVWMPVFSANDSDVHAHRVSRSVLPVGNRLFIDTTVSTLSTDPQVADCPGRDAFVVVFTRDGNVLARAVNAVNGLVNPIATIAAGAQSGCVATDTSINQVLCVWRDFSDTSLRSRLVAVSASLVLTPGAEHTIATSVRGSTAASPRLSKSDRGTGRHAVVFERRLSGDTDPALLVLDRNGAVLSSELRLNLAPGSDSVPEVDGDGTTWIAAWQTAGTTPFIRGASISFDPVSHQLTVNAFNPSLSVVGVEDCIEPAVTWIEDSCVVGFSRRTTAGREARASSIDPFQCLDCEGRFSIGVASRVEGRPVGCAAPAGGFATEDMLLAWEQSLSGNGDVIVRGWRTEDGVVSSLGGGCGRGGSNRATCARSAHSLTLRLRDALPAATTVLLLSATQLPFGCGICSLLPNVATGITVTLATDAGGEAAVPVPIPANSPLIGVPFLTQWATLDLASPACPLFSMHLSNALRVVIE